MSLQQRLRTMIVVLCGAFVLALGSVASYAPQAAAAPDIPLVTEVSDYPFGGDGGNSGDSSGGGKSKDGTSEKAEKFGGTVTTKIIDLVAGIIKCGLNLASPSVKCSL